MKRVKGPPVLGIARAVAAGGRVLVDMRIALRTGAVLAGVTALGFTVAGCESGEAPHVSDREQRSLPTQQYLLGSALCAGPPAGRRDSAGARRQARKFKALLRALEAQPNAAVTSTYATSDVDPGVHRETLTVRELAETHLRAADFSRPNHDCWLDFYDRLEAALDRADDDHRETAPRGAGTGPSRREDIADLCEGFGARST